MNLRDGAGLLAATALTLIVFGRLWRPYRLFRLTAYLLLGLLAGYVTALSLRQVLIPGLLMPLRQNPQAWPTLLLPTALLVLLILRLSRWPQLGLPAVGWLAGALVGLALAGALRGTLLPQTLAVLVLAPTDGARPGLDILVTVLSTLLTLSVLARFQARRPDEDETVAGWLGFLGRVGHLALMAAAGVYLGSLIAARVTLPVDRVYELVTWWGQVLGGR
ncbi:MAG: hypothetical protein RMN24_12355 [Anaerolineae bacterium]|nr:hypothetical protein [Caldilineales bacterium]MDW8269947.1 hypothetical protein [Anaerolineae bacterium]